MAITATEATVRHTTQHRTAWATATFGRLICRVFGSVSAPPVLASSPAVSSSCWWRGCQLTSTQLFEAISASWRDVTSLRDFIAAVEVGASTASPYWGHRQRAQGRRECLPATTCQRSVRASCYEVRSQFWPRGRDTLSAWLEWQPSRSHPGGQTHQTYYFAHLQSHPPPSVACCAH